jgi:hypothetical protein
VRRALAGLDDAFAYSRDLGVDVWTFAVELDLLHEAGLTDNDLRWLILKNYIYHACETSEGDPQVRVYRPGCPLQFCPRSCFVLTPEGVTFHRSVPPPEDDDPGGCGPGDAPRGFVGALGAGDDDPDRPRWDADRQELSLGYVLIKQFKVPAPNQEFVLSAFEEEGWPHRIDDPIPPQLDIDPKRRLHDTINSLNRCQKAPLMRFLGDGSGQGVRWEPAGRRAVGRGHAASNGRA